MKENAGTRPAYLKDWAAFDATISGLAKAGGAEEPDYYTNARVLGVSYPTYWRLMEHPEWPVSPKLVGTILARFSASTFEELFSHRRPEPRPRWRDRPARRSDRHALAA